MPKICFSAGCTTGYNKSRREALEKGEKIPSLFKAPKDPVLFEIWRKSIPRADRELKHTDFLCARHFKKEDLITFYETELFDGNIFRLERGTPSLKRGAVPCLFPNVPGHSSFVPKESKSPKTRKKKLKETELLPRKKRRTGKSKTSISGTKAKQKKNSSIQLGKENILFEGIVFQPIPLSSPTVQPTLLKEREDAKNETNSTPLQNCSINDSDSSPVDVIEKEYSTLTMCEDILNESNINSASPPSQNCSINDPESSSTGDVLAEEYSIPSICEVILNESNVILPKSVVDEQFSFNFLRINVNMIDTMNSWWQVNVLDDFISFIRWMPDYTVERKIIITKELAVKVFLKDKETAIGRDLKNLSVDVISKLIYRVEKTIICRGIHKKERNCDGFLQGVFQCKKHNLCLGCIKWEREQRKLLMKPVKNPRNLVELIRFNMNE